MELNQACLEERYNCLKIPMCLLDFILMRDERYSKKCCSTFNCIFRDFLHQTLPIFYTRSWNKYYNQCINIAPRSRSNNPLSLKHFEYATTTIVVENQLLILILCLEARTAGSHEARMLNSTINTNTLKKSTTRISTG